MKYEDLKIVQTWREYAGPKDERLEAENAKICKIGFVLLSFGMLMIFFYQFIYLQVECVHIDSNAEGLCRYQSFWANRASSCWIFSACQRS